MLEEGEIDELNEDDADTYQRWLKKKKGPKSEKMRERDFAVKKQKKDAAQKAMEAAALAAAVGAVLAAGELSAAELGVITPYAAQVAALQRALQALPARLGAAAVEVSSVDGFQGREKELIFISTVRANAARRIGFVADERRLNVMITRARRGLVVFGAAGTLEADATWRAYLQWLRRRRCFVPAGAPSIFGESREPAVTSVDAADSG
eukprot:Transcript_2678.p1 GENE.Transcript_2678~~Transcript_2678.p1  ORF type:complete len:208 (-),score=109.04 Transcript_2678:69-692(-)